MNKAKYLIVSKLQTYTFYFSILNYFHEILKSAYLYKTLITCALSIPLLLAGQTDSLLPNQVDTIRLTEIGSKPASKRVHPDSVLAYANTFVGKKYRRGGTTLNGFDCSGYTMMVYKKFGVKLPHSSAAQSLVGIEVPMKQISKGDLIFFRGRNSRRRGVGHVGIVISEKGQPVKFIHSSTSHGVRVDALDSPYYKKRYMKTTRVVPLK